jgi:homeobox protein cut-like
MQIAELEAEASRLLKALDQLKEAKSESERVLQRKVDEAVKDAATQVICSSNLDLSSAYDQATEIESLRGKVKQFGDYDEIKRELEIMKVS